MEIITTYFQNPYLLTALILWDLIWRAQALWKSSKKGQKYWFIALLVVNSVGILPIVYLLIDKYRVSKQQQQGQKIA